MRLVPDVAVEPRPADEPRVRPLVRLHPLLDRPGRCPPAAAARVPRAGALRRPAVPAGVAERVLLLRRSRALRRRALGDRRVPVRLQVPRLLLGELPELARRHRRRRRGGLPDRAAGRRHHSDAVPGEARRADRDGDSLRRRDRVHRAAHPDRSLLRPGRRKARASELAGLPHGQRRVHRLRRCPRRVRRHHARAGQRGPVRRVDRDLGLRRRVAGEGRRVGGALPAPGRTVRRRGGAGSAESPVVPEG